MGEVGNFVDSDQFQGGSRTTCGPTSIAAIVLSTAPGTANHHTATEIQEMTRHDYEGFIGPNIKRDTQGTDQATAESILSSHSLTYEECNPDWATIRGALHGGRPVIICIAESQIEDVVLGGSPYPWDTSGFNHIIVVSGMDGNDFLFRDSANVIPPNTLRPGPRRYNVNMMSPFWAIVVTPSWYGETEEEPVVLGLNDAIVKMYFTDAGQGRWRCKNGNVLFGGNLDFYRRNGGPGLLGLPLSDEIRLAQYPNTAIVVCERAVIVYDPQRHIDHPPIPEEQACYLLHVNEGIGKQLLDQGFA